jgi:hypothetical protein
MSEEAMNLALEVLIQLRTPLRVNTSLDAYDVGRAITSLRQAIAEAEKQEPVAWIEHHKGGDNLVWDEPNKGTPLYTISQSKREPAGDKYTSFGLMGGDKFVNQDSLKRSIT